jgi:hypothetical protein
MFTFHSILAVSQVSCTYCDATCSQGNGRGSHEDSGVSKDADQALLVLIVLQEWQPSNSSISFMIRHDRCFCYTFVPDVTLKKRPHHAVSNVTHPMAKSRRPTYIGLRVSWRRTGEESVR